MFDCAAFHFHSTTCFSLSLSVCMCMSMSIYSVCLWSVAVATNDASKSVEPRAPLAEMEDIEMKKKKDKQAAEVQYTALHSELLISC